MNLGFIIVSILLFFLCLYEDFKYLFKHKFLAQTELILLNALVFLKHVYLSLRERACERAVRVASERAIRVASVRAIRAASVRAII